MEVEETEVSGNQVKMEVAGDQARVEEKGAAVDQVTLAKAEVSPSYQVMADEMEVVLVQDEDETEVAGDQVKMEDTEAVQDQVKMEDTEAVQDEVKMEDAETVKDQVKTEDSVRAEQDQAKTEEKETVRKQAKTEEAGTAVVEDHPKVAEEEAAGNPVLHLPMSRLELNDFITAIVQKIAPQDVEMVNKRQLVSESLQISRAESMFFLAHALYAYCLLLSLIGVFVCVVYVCVFKVCIRARAQCHRKKWHTCY